MCRASNDACRFAGTQAIQYAPGDHIPMVSKFVKKHETCNVLFCAMSVRHNCVTPYPGAQQFYGAQIANSGRWHFGWTRRAQNYEVCTNWCTNCKIQDWFLGIRFRHTEFGMHSRRINWYTTRKGIRFQNCFSRPARFWNCASG